MSVGSFCLVLHGHHPYVLHHGDWPHGEQWLFESAAHTWLPMLQALDEVCAAGGRSGLSLDLTPVLLEQLSDARFVALFPGWLLEREAQAHRDLAEFTSRGDLELQALAQRWMLYFHDLGEHFQRIDGDIPRAFAQLWRAGRIELMSSCATHGYLPLLRDDASLRAQIRTGLRTSERILGARPKGFWLPECAYRPAGPWTPPVLDAGRLERAGIEQLLADEGVEWTVVPEHLLRGARSEGIRGPQGYQKVGWDHAAWDSDRRWRSPLEAHAIATLGQDSGVVAVARHGQVSEQISSARLGYPRDSRYLEFHKTRGPRGLRYWRVSSPKSELHDKQRYEPEQAVGAPRSHAQHFKAVIQSTLSAGAAPGQSRGGVVCAAFDAELFGHWWHEGPTFLKELWLALSADPQIDLRTVSEHLAKQPAQVVAWLPEGSRGHGGDHRVWFNEPLRWTWEVVHRAEGRLQELISLLPWRRDPELQRTLTAAAREALLMQSSDWQFVVASGSAVDYGLKRFAGHASNFDAMCDLAWALHQGRAPDPALIAALALHQVQSGDAFADLDLRDWLPMDPAQG